jgi:hypothetical protein
MASRIPASSYRITRWTRLGWWLEDWAPYVVHRSRERVGGAWVTLVRREWLTPLVYVRAAWHRLTCKRCRLQLHHRQPLAERAFHSRTPALSMFARKRAELDAVEESHKARLAAMRDQQLNDLEGLADGP